MGQGGPFNILEGEWTNILSVTVTTGQSEQQEKMR